MLAASLVLLRSRHCLEVLHTEVRLLVGRKEKMGSSISSGKLEISVIFDVINSILRTLTTSINTLTLIFSLSTILYRKLKLIRHN